MKKELFNEVTICDKQDCKCRLTYYLLTGCVNEEFCDLTVYGVEIDRRIEYHDGKRERDKKIIPDLFFVKDEAVEFLQNISKNKVVPTGLKYAIREYIGTRLQTKNIKSAQ